MEKNYNPVDEEDILITLILKSFIRNPELPNVITSETLAGMLHASQTQIAAYLNRLRKKDLIQYIHVQYPGWPDEELVWVHGYEITEKCKELEIYQMLLQDFQKKRNRSFEEMARKRKKGDK